MRRVVWSETAARDYLGIIKFIATENPFAAEEVGERMVSAAENLGALATGHKGRVVGTFELAVPDLPYVIAYALQAPKGGPEQVVILRVIHTSRHWPDNAWPR